MRKFFLNSYNFLLVILGFVFISSIFFHGTKIQGVINITAPIILIIYALILTKLNNKS